MSIYINFNGDIQINKHYQDLPNMRSCVEVSYYRSNSDWL